jgi:hypothetical protein
MVAGVRPHDRQGGRRSSSGRSTRKGTVTIAGAVPGHKYTVNFLSFRLWEEISMYNHITNNWGDREHLAAVDPMQPDVQQVLLAFLDQWLRDHPDTSVVRFTSMFYNFSWFWGDNQAKLRDIYSDWGDYEMTVSPRALTLSPKSTATGSPRRTSSTAASTTPRTTPRRAATATTWSSSTTS